MATGVAVPEPVPAPVATKYTPTKLAAAPMLVNGVVPREVITYPLPTTNPPALSTTVSLPLAMEFQFEVLGNAVAAEVQEVPFAL